MTILMAGVCCTSLVFALPLRNSSEEAARHFTKGNALIELNCGTCYGKSQSGVEEGIAEVLKAIELGYTDKFGAYRVVAKGYNVLWLVFAGENTPEGESYRRSQVEVYERLYELAPEDPDALFYYATSRESAEETIRLLRRLIEIAPEYANAYSVLGLHLRRQGRVQEAIEMRRLAILHYENPAVVRSAVRALLTQMKNAGCGLREEEEGKWRSHLSEAIKAVNYYGNRKKLEEFKTRFSEALESNTCPEIAGPRGGDQ